jgi:hypothetical protein
LNNQKTINVSFLCDNQLPEGHINIEGGGILYTPYEFFLPQKVIRLESFIVNELNQSFSKIISNDVFHFVSGSTKEKGVFFDVRYTIGNTDSIFTWDTQDEKKKKEGFRGVFINWKINIFIRGRSIKKLEFHSLPADRFKAQEGLESVFTQMAITAFVDFNKKLQLALE